MYECLKTDVNNGMNNNVMPGQNSFNFLEIVGESPIAVIKDQSLLEASLLGDVPLYHDCGGKGRCTTCRVLVVEGEENLTEPNKQEMLSKEKMHLPPSVRLACQTRLKQGHVKVQRIIRDENDICFYVGTRSKPTVTEIGREQKLALFFLDIKDFTPFIESNLPFDVAHILRRLFKIFYDGIQTYHGKVIDTSGDGLYAVFGLEGGSIAEVTSNAAKAGFTILEELSLQNSSYFIPHFNHTFEIGIGIHSGNAIVGNLGTSFSGSLSAIGYSVNVASRLQAITRLLNNDFIISEEAFKLLDFRVNGLKRSVKLKGVKTDVEVYLIGKPYLDQERQFTILFPA